MAFVNLSLLLGTLLIGIPIALHLVMRQQPKQLQFPAVRFIRKRHEANRRTLRLRHWILLLLRCLVLALFALALARPSVSSSQFGNWIVITALGLLALLLGLLLLVGALTRQGRWLLGTLALILALALAALGAMTITTLQEGDAPLTGDRQAPVAAVMVFDASPRMAYRRENRTRLQQAQEMADAVVRDMPFDSEVAVMDSRGIRPVFSQDLSAARKALERVEITGAPRSLDQLLKSALQLLAQSQLKRKEIYLYTDLAAAAWEWQESTELKELLDRANEVGLYLIDVGIEEPVNVAVTEVTPSAEVLPENGQLSLRATVSCIGPGGQHTVELLVEDLDPTLPVLRDGKLVLPTMRVQSRHEVTLAPNGSETLNLSLGGLTKGTRHATVRLVRQDALPVDDQQSLSVVVREPWLLLVVAPAEVNTAGFVEAIAPYQHRVEKRAAYECLVVTPDELSNRLQEFAAIILLDPPTLPAGAWEKLGGYVRDGGQLALFLGAAAGDGNDLRTAPAQELLPGKLGASTARLAAIFTLPRTITIIRSCVRFAPFRPASRGISIPCSNTGACRNWRPMQKSSRVTVISSPPCSNTTSETARYSP